MAQTGQETNPGEKALDGTVGGALDTEGAGQSQDTHRTDEHKHDEWDPAKAMDDVKADKELGDKINAAFQKMKDLEEERTAINDELKSIRQSLVASHGLPMATVKMAYKLHCMDLDKVQEVLIGVAVVAKATELPVQIDFLDKASVTNIH